MSIFNTDVCNKKFEHDNESFKLLFSNMVKAVKFNSKKNCFQVIGFAVFKKYYNLAYIIILSTIAYTLAWLFFNKV